MRMIVLGLMLLAAVTPALGQTAAPRQQQDEGTSTDHPKAGDLLWPALKLLQDAKRREDEKRREEKRRKEEEAQTPAPQPTVEPTAEPTQVATTPAQETPAPRPPVLHKPRVSTHPVRVTIVPKPRPEPPGPVSVPSEAPPPVQQAAATSPPAELHPAPSPVKPPSVAQTPVPADAERSWNIGSWSVAAGLLLLLVAAAYALWRIFFPAGPLPQVRAQVDAGTVSAPLFDQILPSMSLMIGAGAFATSTDYPEGASAS